MHLLQLQDCGDLERREYIGEDIPRYAILSHTWGANHEEVTFQDLDKGIGKSKAGYRKIRFCGDQAAKDQLQFFWVDSCCIDKSSSAELQESILSMFQWYQRAARCYVYLSDVSTKDFAENGPSSHVSQQTWLPAFRNSRWFRRGWTLQELIAPESVEFFSAEGELLGTKTSLLQEIYSTTKIPIRALKGDPLVQFSIPERKAWARDRRTKREEDMAYALLGIFQVYMPILYGEGRARAMYRLQKEIDDFPMFVISQISSPTSSSQSLGLHAIPDTGNSWGPSAVVYNDKIYCFHHGLGDCHELWYNVFDGTWHGDQLVPDTGISCGPSVVVYAGKIFVFHRGDDDASELYYNVFDGSEWQGESRVPNAKVMAEPFAVVFRDELYCFYQADRETAEVSHELCYEVFDGLAWSDEVEVPDTGLANQPSAVVYGDELYCFHHDAGSWGDLWYNVFDGLEWRGETLVPNTAISNGPSAVVYDDKIFCFHEGAGDSGRLWCNEFDGSRWLGDTMIPITSISNEPSVVAAYGKIYYFHHGHGENGQIWYGMWS